MLYDVYLCTKIDSTHEERKVYSTISTDNLEIQMLIIPNLNRLAHIINMRHGIYGSNKKVYFRIIPKVTLNKAEFIDRIWSDVENEVIEYNKRVRISNKATRAYNLQHHIVEYDGLRKEINSDFLRAINNDFDTTLIESETMEYLAIGKI